MYNVILTIHVIVAISLIGMILIQRGRSGGLVEALGGVESIFGTKTSAFFVKVTVGLSIGFFLTSISLSYLSKQKGKSLMNKYKSISAESENIIQEPAAPQEELPPRESSFPEDPLEDAKE